MKQRTKATTISRQFKCKASSFRRNQKKEQIQNFLKYENDDTRTDKESVPWQITGYHHTYYRKNAG